MTEDRATPRVVGDVMAPARECSVYTTLAEVEAPLRGGVPVFFRDAETWRRLSLSGAVGYPRERRVIDIPAEAVIAVAPTTGLDEASVRMRELGVSALPVVVPGGLIGAVGAGDRGVREASDDRHLSGMLHDVANLVHSSLLSLEFAVADGECGAEAEALQMLRFACETIRERRTSETIRLLELGQELDSMAPLLHSVCGGGLRLCCDDLASLPPVLGNPIFLRRVLVNLALNARAGVPAGGCLRVGAEVCIDRPQVVLRVSDDGPGLPPAVLARLRSTSWRGWSGSEGLEVVRQLTAKMGATLQVDSAPGAGTTFSIAFTIPPH